MSRTVFYPSRRRDHQFAAGDRTGDLREVAELPGDGLGRFAARGAVEAVSVPVMDVDVGWPAARLAHEHPLQHRPAGPRGAHLHYRDRLVAAEVVDAGVGSTCPDLAIDSCGPAVSLLPSTHESRRVALGVVPAVPL